MKRLITKFSAWIILAVMIVMLIPGIGLRIASENENDNITISLLYNNIMNKVTQSTFDATFEQFKEMGVDTVSIMEDDLNFLTSNGDVTCIKYNVLRHKYDAESIEIADVIEDKCPNITYDSYIILAPRDEVKQKLKYMLPRRYTDKEYADIGSVGDMDVYVLYDGRKQLWDYALGYDEKVIERFKNEGFNIALIHKVKNYSNVQYLEDIDRIVKEYDVEYMNLKEDTYEYPDEEKNDKNYKGIADIINNNGMTLVVTENTNQLSNQKCFGYSYIFDETMKEGGTQKVVRSYETYDESQADPSNYKYRTEQFFNSTIDRNIRFITVTILEPKNIPYEQCADYTVKAVELYKEKVEKLGFTVNGQVAEYNYHANKTFNSAVCAVIMLMCVLLMLQMITGKKSFALTVFAIIVSVIAFAGTFILPDSLLGLYPTVFTVVQSCFAMTCVLCFVKTMKEKLSGFVLTIATVALMLAVLLLGALGMGTMLSGLEYYINNDIFRGIKLSLIVPILYTAIIFYFVFIKNTHNGILVDVKKALTAEIKVYWLVIAGFIGAVGVYYIIRSGNVSQISGAEHLLRSTLTEIFPARPRTKEFLIGYPALVLLVYYAKQSDINILKWFFAVGASILAASITNSFCHVFTDFSVIVTRTINGLLIGIIVSIVVYIANLILVKVIKAIGNRLN